MKIKLLRNGKPASEAEILALETSLGYRLPDSFRAFVAKHDGAKPEPNEFEISHNNGGGVSRFIALNEILKQSAYIENLPRRAYPVATTSGGNFVFIDEDKNGAVFFWDHEVPDEITQLAPSFGAFLDLLEPFDINTVELKPGQVEKVWIDPEFLKKLRGHRE
jgi:hypothetical protein